MRCALPYLPIISHFISSSSDDILQPLCYLAGSDSQLINDRHRNPNINTKIILWATYEQPPPRLQHFIWYMIYHQFPYFITPHCYSHLQLYHLIIMSFFASNVACSEPKHLILPSLPSNFISTAFFLIYNLASNNNVNFCKQCAWCLLCAGGLHNISFHQCSTFFLRSFLFLF